MKTSRLAVKFCVWILILVFMQGCSMHIEKRRYNTGYHVEVIKKHIGHKDEIEKTYPPDVDQITTHDKTDHKFSELIDQPVHSLKENIKTGKPGSYPLHILERGGDDCDVVHFKKGKTMLCTYIQMTDVIFTYKECGGKTKNVQSINIEKVDFVVLSKGDTIYPQNKAYEWTKEHGVTDAKTKKQLLKRGGGHGGASALYIIMGLIAIGAGVGLLALAAHGLGLWVFFVGFLVVFFGVCFIIGGIVLIILGIITAFRK